MTTLPVLRRIACAVDLSEHSRLALRHAVALANLYGAELVAVHAVSPGELPATADELRRFTADAGRVVASRVVEGVAWRTILEQASELSADALVIGSHGRAGIERLLLGSVAEKVIRRASSPVMTITASTPYERQPSFSRVLCAVDFSPSANRALTYALSVADRAAGQLAVLHVLEMPEVPEEMPECPDYDVDEYWRGYRETSCRRLEEQIPASLRARCSIDVVMAPGASYKEILRNASDGHHDLVVVGTQGRGAVDRLFVGSTAEQIVRAAECPVMTVRPD